jgi:hypothetical protein
MPSCSGILFCLSGTLSWIKTHKFVYLLIFAILQEDRRGWGWLDETWGKDHTGATIMSEKEEKESRKARKKREKKLEKLEKKLTQSEGKQKSKLPRTGSAYFQSSTKSPSSDGIGSSSKPPESPSKLKRLASLSSRNLSPSSFRKNSSAAPSPLNSPLSVSSSTLLSSPSPRERRGTAAGKSGGSSIGGIASKKLKRLSASFDPRKGFSMGGSGSSRTLKMDRIMYEDDDDSGMSDSEGGFASSEAMLAKYLPFLAPVATKVAAQAMTTTTAQPTDSSASTPAVASAGASSAASFDDDEDDSTLPGDNPSHQRSSSVFVSPRIRMASFALCFVFDDHHAVGHLRPGAISSTRSCALLTSAVSCGDRGCDRRRDTRCHPQPH